ncbi:MULTISPECIES: ABC-type transport auxiliary lipoprotein family protein [unclassified Helicobacter]|uniref:ABC-type transport auxiliary lipoprotein family protein n=1 Tax=unclassified Helicobacter TaxID=2593540 RepID=UPI000CF0E6FF|nr:MULTISPECIES: ABC-type transport auxiliary lipoprotein family protein [unclassified Helicobacter]
MKQIILFLVFILFFGCVDVKIKSEIPKRTYYDLDTRDINARHCSRFKTIGIGNITAITSLNNKNIIRKKSNGEIEIYNDIQWVDHPKDMIQSMLIKQGYEKCLSFEKASMNKVHYFVSLEILFLGFLDQNPSIEFAYKISNERFQIVDMGIVKKIQDGGSIQDLQQISQDSINELLKLVETKI